jgi:hypothetical protein
LVNDTTSLIHCSAKQLKNSWVQAQKIKSKWKAQKRKEGFATGSNRAAPAPSAETPNEDQSQHDSSDEDTSESEQHSKRAVDESAAKPSLRELAKKAYALSSLHNHRSDPLHKRKGETFTVNRGGPQGRGGSGRGTGRGQPNMKLRMNAMLEKIKQDFV